MLALLTPEIDAVVAWFEGTHELTSTGWRRSTLPAAGGYGDQDSKLMQQLDHLRTVRQGLWQGKPKRKATTY